MVFIENDAKLLLQRLPEDVKNDHYHDDETHIRQLLEKHELVPKRGTSMAAVTVREKSYMQMLPMLARE